MNWLSQARQRRQMRDDLHDEIREHLEEKALALMREGLSREEAKRQERIAFGNPTMIGERGGEVWAWPILAALKEDLRFALRQIRYSPGFAIAATLTLILGIGANFAIFNILNALLLESLPVHDPDSLVHLAARNRGATAFGVTDAPINLNLPIIESIRQRSRSFDGVLGWSAYDVTLDESGAERRFPGALVSGNAFALLGLKPVAGRLLDAQDDQPGGSSDRAAVLSYSFWREHYGGSPAVIGEHIRVSDQTVVIVGVAPRGFDSVQLDSHPDLYLPLEFDVGVHGTHSNVHQAGAMWLTTLARLKPGVTRPQAAAEMNVLWPGILDAVTPAKMRHLRFIENMRFSLTPGRTGWSYLRVVYSRPLAILQGLVVLLFLLCCANLAGLCLARAMARQQEFAIRGALGATRLRLLRQVLVESLVLAMPGACLALLFAWQADRILIPMLNQGGMRLAVRFDPWLLFGAPVAAIVAAAFFGILPAWFASRFAPTPVHGQPARNTPRGASRLAGWLFLPLQIAASLVLIVAAGLLTATLIHLRTDNLGFETDGVYLAGIDFSKLHLEPAQTLLLEQTIAGRLTQLPGVAVASFAANTPLNGGLASGEFAALTGMQPAANPIQLDTNEVGPGFFAGLRTPVLQGREFTHSAGDANACILNLSASRRLFGAMSPLGGTIRVSRNQLNGEIQTRECQVIGVVADAKYDALRANPPATVYQALAQGGHDPATATLVLRARSLGEAEGAFAKAMDELGRGITRGDVIPFAEQVDASVQRERIMALLANFFAVLALLLSAVGVFGVMGWTVAQRRAEIGVRMALGATRESILRHFLGAACRVVLVGLAAGLVGAQLASASLRSLLYGVGSTNLTILLLSVAVLAGTIILAAYFPARRAASIDPMQALRRE